jgi:transposase-like protein
MPENTQPAPLRQAEFQELLHEKMRAAIRLTLITVLRGVNHKMDNVLSYIPHSQRDQVEPELRAIFYQHRRAAADQAWLAFCEKYRPLYPTAIECLQRDGEACLTFYAFPKDG